MARTDETWEEVRGSYLKTLWAAGRDILINGYNHYLNFGFDSGDIGYGFRDDDGTMQFKNYEGVWVDIPDIDPSLFIYPTVSLTGGGSYEKGQVIEDVELSWVCNKTMETRNLSAPVPEADRLRGEGQNGTYTHTGANISTNTTYSITVSDTVNTATATTSLSFKLMFYWGTSAEESLNNSEVLALDKELKTASEEIEFSIDGNGEYLYFIYPTEWGAKDIYVNGFVVTEWELSVVPITNPFGDVTNYNMVRSTIKQNGDNIIITLKQYGQ